MQPQVSLKGFRPGKVPTSHIRKMFGQSIMKDVVEETVNETTQKAINDNKIRPAGQPQVDLQGTADLEYQLTVESIPDFEPVDPEKLKFTRLTHEADEKELEEEVAKLGEGQIISLFWAPGRSFRVLKINSSASKLAMNLMLRSHSLSLTKPLIWQVKTLSSQRKLSKFKARKTLSLMMSLRRSLVLQIWRRSKPLFPINISLSLRCNHA